MYLEAKGHHAKAQIAKNVVTSFLEMGGTFYYKKDAEWIEAPIEIVLKKVKQALREKGANNARAPRPSRISSRGQMCRRGTTARSFHSSSSSLGSKKPVGEKVLITRFDGTMMDALSVSSFAQTSIAPTSQQESEDRYPIDSGHWRRLQFQSKNKYSKSMIDRLSVASFSTAMTADSYKPPSTMQSSGDIHTLCPIDQQSTNMTQAMAIGYNHVEMKQQQLVQSADVSELGQSQMLHDQNIVRTHSEYAQSLSNQDVTNQGQASDCPLLIPSSNLHQQEEMNSNHSPNMQPLPQEQFNVTIPLRKSEHVQVNISSLTETGTNSLDDAKVNLHNARIMLDNAQKNYIQVQNSLLQQRSGNITPSGGLEKQDMGNEELSSYLANVDDLEHIETNYPENENLDNDLNLDDIFEERIRTNNARLGEEFQLLRLS